MKFRIVTATLAVALGAWSGGIAFAQAQENIAQEDILDFAAPARGLSMLQSELPLQGVLNDSMIHGSIAESFPPQSPSAADGGWLDTVRRLLRGAPRREIAMASAALFALFVAGWIVASAVSRRRSWRAYRRFPRSSGGSRLQGLEAVVAAVQLGRTRRAGQPPMREPVTGRE